MTMLTWCEDCGTDMHVEGGEACECGLEFCFRCMKRHRKECPENEEN